LPSATSIPQATATETAQPLNNLNVGPTVVPTAIPVANLVVQRPFPYFYYVPRSEETPTPTYSAPTVVPTATSTPLPPPPTPDLRPRATPTSVVIALPALTEDWLLILLPTQVYSVDMEPLWMAEAGDWFRVIAAEDDYLLAVGADDADTPVWIEADATNVFRLTLEARGAGL